MKLFKFLAWPILCINIQAHAINYNELIKDLDTNKSDSLNEVLKILPKDTNAVKTLIQLCVIYQSTDFEKSMAYANQALEIAEQLDFKEGRAYIYYNQALCNAFIEHYTEANEYYFKALDLFTDMKMRPKMAGCNRKIGQLCLFLGKYPEASKYLIDASRIYEEILDSNNLAHCYNDISVAFFNSDDLKNAEKYMLQALKINELLKDERSAFTNLIGLGNFSNMRGNQKKAEGYYLRAAVLAEKLGQDRMKAITYGSLGFLYISTKQYDKAIKYAKMSVIISERTQDKQRLLSGYSALSSAYIAKKDWHLALDAIKKWESYIGQETMIYDAVDLYESYSFVYENLGQKDEALKYYKKFMSFKDTVFKAESAEKMAELNIEYETERKDNELKRKEAEIANQNLINEQQQAQLVTVGVSLVVVLALAVLIFINLRKVGLQKKLIETKNQENELLLGEIHHRVKNNLQMISSLLSLQQRGIEDKRAKEAFEDGGNRVRSMALVHKKLYQHEDYSSIEMLDYTRQLAEELISNLGKERNIKLSTDIKDLKLDVDTAVPLGLIMNELLTNTLKYAFKDIDNPKIAIKLERNNGQLAMEYSDNGICTKEMLKDVKTSKSFGTDMVDALTQQLKGEKKVFADQGLHYSFVFSKFKEYA